MLETRNGHDTQSNEDASASRAEHDELFINRSTASSSTTCHHEQSNFCVDSSDSSRSLQSSVQQVQGFQDSSGEEAVESRSVDDVSPLNRIMDQLAERCMGEQSNLSCDCPHWATSSALVVRDALGSSTVSVAESHSSGRQPAAQTTSGETDNIERVSVVGLLRILRQVVQTGQYAGAVAGAGEILLAIDILELFDHSESGDSLMWLEGGSPSQQATLSRSNEPDVALDKTLLARQRRSFAKFRRSTEASMLDSPLLEQCPICLDGLETGQSVCRLPCKHVLHRECAETYFKTPGTKVICPICRARINGPQRKCKQKKSRFFQAW